MMVGGLMAGDHALFTSRRVVLPAELQGELGLTGVSGVGPDLKSLFPSDLGLCSLLTRNKQTWYKCEARGFCHVLQPRPTSPRPNR